MQIKQVSVIQLKMTPFVTEISLFNSFPVICEFCHLLITFANSLDSDQARQNVGPDLDPNC